MAKADLRICNTCGQTKTLSTDFDNDGHGAGGKSGRCKECRNAAQRKRFHTGDGLQGALDNGYKRAKECGRRAYRYTYSQLISRWETNGIDPDRCYYTGTQLTREPGLPNTRNLDHVEPLSIKGTAGHVLRNIVPCSRAYNDYKRSGSALAKYMDATEELQPVYCYAGLANGHADIDQYGNPNAPAQTIWGDSDSKPVTVQVPIEVDA